MATKPPPMDPNTDEADAKQLDLARQQGESYRRALEHMANDVAHDGGMQEAGEYLIGYAVEEAEGMYMWEDGGLVWHDPACAAFSTSRASRQIGGDPISL